MQFITTFFWSFLLVHMASYVIGAMQGAPYNFATASLFSVVFSLLVIGVGSLIPSEPVEHH